MAPVLLADGASLIGRLVADGGVRRCCCWPGAHATLRWCFLGGRQLLSRVNTNVFGAVADGVFARPPKHVFWLSCQAACRILVVPSALCMQRGSQHPKPIRHCLCCQTEGNNRADDLCWKCATQQCDWVGWRGWHVCYPLGWVGTAPHAEVVRRTCALLDGASRCVLHLVTCVIEVVSACSVMGAHSSSMARLSSELAQTAATCSRQDIRRDVFDRGPHSPIRAAGGRL